MKSGVPFKGKVIRRQSPGVWARKEPLTQAYVLRPKVLLKKKKKKKDGNFIHLKNLFKISFKTLKIFEKLFWIASIFFL